jgi:phosphate transport system ATP-binding protein
MIAKLQNLSVAFGEKTILQGISLEIPAQKITVLIGRSGSGKTTLLRVFNRLNEEFPRYHSTGTYDFFAEPAKNLPVTKLRLQAGMLFQTPNLLPVSIWKNIAMPVQKLLATSKEDVISRVETSLKDVGLWDEVKDRLHQPADILSGGQQQRLCLARVLALSPKMLLLDEPTASLDIAATREIETLLRTLKQKYTIVMVSHSLHQAASLADQLVVLESGRIEECLQGEISEASLAPLLTFF